MTEPAIETTGLTRNYGSLVAVDNLNLRVQRNTIHGFLGPNGAGKSTTIKMLVGLLRPTRGSAMVLGREVKGDDPRARQRVGFMPELPRLPKHLKATEVLDVYGRMCGIDEQERRTEIPRLIKLVGLKGREEDLIGKYSKGMQQRIGIAQALLGNPELVILDEPSIGLDPVGMVEVRELMKGISKEGRTVFLSSHLLFEVEQVCSYVTIINKGTALVSDTMENVLHKVKGPVTLHIEVAELTGRIVDSLRGLPFVTDIAVEGNRLILTIGTDEDVRSQISKIINGSGGTIVSMSQTGKSLEDVFVQLVGTSQEGN